MAFELRAKPHTLIRNRTVIEILQDGEVCGVIYPSDTGVKIVSAHFGGEIDIRTRFPTGISMDDGRHSNPPIPHVTIDFEVQPYRIAGGRIVKIKPS